MATKNNGTNRARQALPLNPAEAAVDTEQQEKAMRLISMLAQGGQAPQYKPVLKSLKEIGITPKTMPVMIGDEPEDCLVIPVAELMGKEWKFMSGLDKEQENV